MKTTILLMTVLGSTSALAKTPTGKGPCKNAAACEHNVCVEVNGDSYCSQACGGCPAGMYCDEQLFAMLSLKVCAKGSEESPTKIEQQPPRLPCATDKDCQGALVCAQMMGVRDCTLPCTAEAQCQMPEIGGVKLDFLTCAADEGQKSRKACLPKKTCLAKPASCMSVKLDATSAMAGAMMGMGASVQVSDTATSEPARPGVAPSQASAPAPTSAASAAPTRVAMSEGRFKALLDQVKSESFESERNAVLETAVATNYFTCQQIGRVLDVISMGGEKLSALALLAPRRVDAENSHTLIARFTFDDEKAKARSILTGD